MIIKKIESGRMDIPEELMQASAEEDKPMRISPNKAGKFSIIAAIVGIVINFACDALFQERSTAVIMAGIAAGVAIAVGVAAAMWGLARAWKCPGKNAILLAGAGLFLNGILIVMGFITLPISGKLDMGPKMVSAIDIDVRPVSAKGGRTIVTRDWTAGYAVEVTDKNFDDVINNSDIPVLVDFWAPWCGLCGEMRPVIEQIAAKYEGRVKVCKLNVDIGRETTSSFKITGIPTIILFKNDRIKEKWIGVTGERNISSAIEKLL